MTNRDNNEPKRADIYEEFILWTAMPPKERGKLGIETQEQFVEYYGIGINTPAAWKKRKDFEPRVTALRREWAFGKTTMVIEGIYHSALKGNPFSQKLWLQYFHGFSEKSEVTQKTENQITVADIRFLIETLPEPQKTKHYTWLRQLLDDSVAFANVENVNMHELAEAVYRREAEELGASRKAAIKSSTIKKEVLASDFDLVHPKTSPSQRHPSQRKSEGVDYIGPSLF